MCVCARVCVYTHHNSKLLRLWQICVLIFILGQGVELILLWQVLYKVLQREWQEKRSEKQKTQIEPVTRKIKINIWQLLSDLGEEFLKTCWNWKCFLSFPLISWVLMWKLGMGSCIRMGNSGPAIWAPGGFPKHPTLHVFNRCGKALPLCSYRYPVRGTQWILGGEPHLHVIQSLYCRCVSMDCMAVGWKVWLCQGCPLLLTLFIIENF